MKKKSKRFIGYSDISALLRISEYLSELSFGVNSWVFVKLNCSKLPHLESGCTAQASLGSDKYCRLRVLYHLTLSGN